MHYSMENKRMVFKRKRLPCWSRVQDYVLKNKQPNKIMSIVNLGEGLWINIHTDVNIYDLKNKIMWKGDLV